MGLHLSSPRLSLSLGCKFVRPAAPLPHRSFLPHLGLGHTARSLQPVVWGAQSAGPWHPEMLAPSGAGETFPGQHICVLLSGQDNSNPGLVVYYFPRTWKPMEPELWFQSQAAPALVSLSQGSFSSSGKAGSFTSCCFNLPPWGFLQSLPLFQERQALLLSQGFFSHSGERSLSHGLGFPCSPTTWPDPSITKVHT